MFSALLVLGVAALSILGFALNRYRTEQAGRIPKNAELAQSALLIALAVIIWVFGAGETPLATLATLICFGMVCGFVGDLFMANVFKMRNYVLSGMVAFAVGHVYYILGFREIALNFGLHNLGSYAVAFAATWALAVILWFALIRKPGGDVMQYFALGYALFLASMGGFALGLALQRGAFFPLALGILLFMLSDTLIGARLFGGRTFPFIGDAIWITYIIAQLLIVTVTLTALALFRFM